MAPLIRNLRENTSVPDLQYRVERPIVDALTDARDSCARYSQWSLSKEATEALEHLGIACNDCPTKQHSHPACKTIENFIKTIVLPRLIRGRDFSCYWSKAEKAENLRAAANSEAMFLFNRIVTAKDLVRYPGADAAPFPPCPTRVCYVDDAAHYLSKADICSLFFSEGSQVEECFATVIIPPELLVPGLHPLNPSLYTFEVRGDVFEYYPDGCVSEGYEQPLSGLWWLRHKAIQCRGLGTIHITRLASFGSHHLFHLNKQAPNHRAERHFNLGPVIRIPDSFPGFNTSQEVDRIIYRKWFATAYSYGTAVSSVKGHQVTTRIRQVLLKDDVQVSDRDLITCSRLGLLFHESRDKLGGDYRPKYRWRHALTRCRPIMALRRFLNHNNRKFLDCARDLLSSPYYTAPQTLLTAESGPESSHFIGAASVPPSPAKPTLVLDSDLAPNPPGNVDKPSAPKLPFSLFGWFGVNPKEFPSGSCPPAETTAAPPVCKTQQPLDDPVPSRSQPGPPEQRSLLDRFLSVRPSWLRGGLNSSQEEPSGLNSSPEAPLGLKPSPLINVAVIPLRAPHAAPDVQPPYTRHELGLEFVGPHCEHMLHPGCCYAPMPPPEVTCPICLSCPAASNFVQPPRFTSCLCKALAEASGLSVARVFQILAHRNEHVVRAAACSPFLEASEVSLFCARQKCRVFVRHTNGVSTFGNSGPIYHIFHRDAHYSSTPPSSPTPSNNPRNPDQQAPQSQLQVDQSAFFYADPRRAKTFLDSVRAGEYGTVVLQTCDLHAWSEDAKRLKRRQVKCRITGSSGVPGSGKSEAVFQRLRRMMDQKNYKFLVVTPTNALRASVRERLPRAANRGLITTPEFALKECSQRFVVLDDAGKLPPGYLDTLLLRNPKIREVHCTFDPAQSVYHCPIGSSALNNLEPLAVTLSKLPFSYHPTTRRLSVGVAKRLGIPTTSTRAGDFIISRTTQQGLPLLVAASHTKAVLGDVAPALTYNESVGLSFEGDYNVLIDESSLLCDNNAVYTALTRGTGNVYITVSPSLYGDQTFRSSILASIFRRSDTSLAVQKHLEETTPRLRGGRPSLSEVFAAVPSLAPLLDDAPAPTPVWATADRPQMPLLLYPTPSFRALADVLNANSDVATEYVTGLPGLPEDREREFKGSLTNQVNGGPLGAQIFLRHRPTDEATVGWSLSERIARPGSTSLSNRRDLGLALFLAFQNFTGIKAQPFDAAEYEQAAQEDLDRYLDKGLKTLGNICGRNDPLWEENFIELFLKAQAITKPNTQNSAAKKGQIIMCLCTAASTRFGPLAKYVARKMQEFLPENVFFLNGQTPLDLARFCIDKFPFSSEHLEGDFTAYDQSQKEEFILFDAYLFRLLGVPEELVSSYLRHMTSLYTFLGELGAMMPTGHKMTLIMNSMRTLSYLCLRFRIRPGNHLCVSGDDSVIAGAPSERPSWRLLGRRFLLDLKAEYHLYPTFCGWRMTPHGCFKDPRILAARLVYRSARAELGKCLMNYAAELTPAFYIGDLLSTYLDETESELIEFSRESLLLAAEEFGTPLSGFSDESAKARLDRVYDLTSPGISARDQ